MYDASRMGAKTAAALVIGSELLSGKVADANVVVLARTLRQLGISLRRVVMIVDDFDEIVQEVRALSRSYDWVFTSGGVGPTHDDLTIAAVARAFDAEVVTDPGLERMIRAHYGEHVTEGHLRMALVPEGAVLESTETVRWPTVRKNNVWLMPGIPEVFQMKIPVLAARLASGTPFFTKAIYTRLDEGDLKPLLDEVVAAFVDVEVGSYPKWMDATYKTKVTFDAQDAGRVEQASDAFLNALPPDALVRVE